jgi:coenzyme PQQ biosynthesis protein PqqD
MIEVASIVCLAPKARLHFDRHTQRHLLLYPERGLALNQSASDVLLQCVQACSVGAIIEQLVAKYGEAQRPAISEDVLALLRSLAERGLLREVPS